MLCSRWSLFFFWFPFSPVLFLSLSKPFQVHQLQLVSPSLSCFSDFRVFCYFVCLFLFFEVFVWFCFSFFFFAFFWWGCCCCSMIRSHCLCMFSLHLFSLFHPLECQNLLDDYFFYLVNEHKLWLSNPFVSQNHQKLYYCCCYWGSELNLTIIKSSSREKIRQFMGFQNILVIVALVMWFH